MHKYSPCTLIGIVFCASNSLAKFHLPQLLLISNFEIIRSVSVFLFCYIFYTGKREEVGGYIIAAGYLLTLDKWKAETLKCNVFVCGSPSLILL